MRGGKQITIVVDLPKARYRINWVNTLTGKSERNQTLAHPGGRMQLQSPEYVDDIALSIKR